MKAVFLSIGSNQIKTRKYFINEKFWLNIFIEISGFYGYRAFDEVDIQKFTRLSYIINYISWSLSLFV